MKKKILIVVCLLVACVGGLWAKPVNPQQALRVGSTFLQAMGYTQVSQLEAVAIPFEGLYLFSAPRGGFVLVAADDCVQPIWGYSLTATFRVDGMPENLRGRLEDFSREIVLAAQREQAEAKREGSHRNSADAETPSEWQRLASGQAPEPLQPTVVAPLLSTTWNQAPYYNNLCPYDSIYSTHVVTGCVATATAQVMKFWNHPSTGYGSHTYHSYNSHADYGWLTANFGNTTYQWNNMPTELNAASSDSQVEAVATLMSHVGISLEMKYNVSAEGGSSAYNHTWSAWPMPSSQFSLMSHFKYNPDMAVVYRDDYEMDTYNALLRDELNAGRPILFCGSNTSAGHSFVLDGYDAYNLFHVNWGWGNYCDGYFAMGSLNSSVGGIGGNSSGTYNLSNSALLGVRPNTSWGTGGTVSVNLTGTSAGCTVTGAGSYNFGDTVYLFASVPDGYRFTGWSDNCRYNPRCLVMTGGNYSFTANFATIGTDTLSYCGDNHQLNSFGEGVSGEDVYWGVKLPSSTLPSGQQLTGVDFYAVYSGHYDVSIYVGTDAPTTQVSSINVYVSENEAGDWYSVNLVNPVTVNEGQSMWLILHNNEAAYPAAITYGCGSRNALIYGENMEPLTAWDEYSFMVRGRFQSMDIITDGDTLSYCGDQPYQTSWGLGNQFRWGIRIPAEELQGRNYLKAVKLFADFTGVFHLSVYSGGENAPGTLVHTQPADLEWYGWHEITLDATVPLTAGNDLWIVFDAEGMTWPAASCHYTGNRNSDWFTDINGWRHLSDLYDGSQFSWMIKAVTSGTQPVLPPPTVIIQCKNYVPYGVPVTITAATTAGLTPTWHLEGTTPSVATGSTITPVWQQSGIYRIMATVSNSVGTTTDTFYVSAVNCDEAVTDFAWFLGFEEYENTLCIDTYDGDNDGNGWYIDVYGGYRGLCTIKSEARYGGSVPDNWVFLPKMQTQSDKSYSMTWMEVGGGSNGENAYYSVYIDTTAGIDPANYIFLGEYNANWSWVDRYLDLSAYAGKTFRLAFRQHNDYGVLDMLQIDNVTVDGYYLFYEEGDTLSYCGDNERVDNMGNGGTMHWGIKLPAERIAGRESLTSVLIFISGEGDYTLSVYQGGDDAPQQLKHTETRALGTGWQCFDLGDNFVIDTTRNLWITFFSPISYPADFTIYSHDINCDWISLNGTNWQHTTDFNFYVSWLIKAVMPTTDTAAVVIDPVIVDGEPFVYSKDHCIVVEGAEGRGVSVYDVTGRLLHRRMAATRHETFPVQETGVYLVKTGASEARRVVVLR